ncbi:HU family DNA-binding protein [Taibaiella soli]|uniref:DNA-binding protein n=1 Tax=Taibaiella soli TaxID=1649169 RepID=A0A2W2AHN8_9BACT|nr:HU family DNA-binding protein [Taibaiella soli]PZF71740.1 DNA-binding protein [Taibaiella soli]
MSVKFSVSQKHNPLKPNDPKKWYASIHSSGETTLRELSTEISARSTVSSADVLAVLENLLHVIPEEIGKGNIVRLGDFGSFSLTLQSEGMNTGEEVTAASIKGNKLHFRAGKEIVKQLSNLEYKRIK